MHDDTSGFGRDNDPFILLARVGEGHWLIEGEEFLMAMLTGQRPYPTPVRLMIFTDMIELKLSFPEIDNLNGMWGINPDIIARLERDSHILEVPAPGRAG